MSYADEVRAFCATRYIEPARARGDKQVAIRAGDVHDALNYKSRMPLICAALGAAVFEEQYRVKRIGVEGPLNGANTILKFEILA